MTEEASIKAAQFGVWDSLANGIENTGAFEWIIAAVVAFLLLLFI